MGVTTLDDLCRRLATATSRRGALRAVVGLVVGGAAASCASTTSPSCSDGCVGSDNKCYTCPSPFSCTPTPGNLRCGEPTAGGIYCCTSSSSSGGSSSGSSCPCSSGSTYNYLSGLCCPNSAPYYYPGTHGLASPGCYASCPYVGDCGTQWQRC